MNNRWLTYLIHITGWIFLYILPYLFSFEGLPNIFTIFSNPGDYIHAISFCFLIIFAYTDHFVFIPHFYFKKKYISFLLLLAASFWIVAELPVHILPHHFALGMAPPPAMHMPDPHPFLFGRNYTILLFVISVFVSTTDHTRRTLRKSEEEKVKAELSSLKSQINPHFLFNTLNSIYALVINKDDRAADAIVQLSELMRYTLKDTHGGYVSLDKEINYIKNYVALQQARLGETVKIEQHITGDFANKKIAPLLLVTFIENAFKHGVSPDEISHITIHISVDGNCLDLYVMNTQVSSVKDEEGIGLKNVRERLQLLYPSTHTLDILDNKESYVVNLKMNL